ncbi:MAG: hypothetical protein R3F61_20760 [Myxococcota bacterium]
MRRLLAIPVPLLLATACAPGARTIVYAFDEGEPVGELDRSECITGVGLRIPLGPTESIAFDIASDQRTAFLATCDLEGGAVASCGTLDPPIELEIAENVVTGNGSVPVTFTDTDCSGADLESSWTLTLDDSQEHLDTRVEMVWRLHDTEACDLFEAEVLDGYDGSGRIDGCIVTWDFSSTLVSTCKVNGTLLNCD